MTARDLLSIELRKLSVRFELLVNRRARPDCLVLPIPALKVAYVAIPKAANSSIRSALYPLLAGEPYQGHRIQEDTKRFVQRGKSFFSEDRSDWYVFTFVRDPSKRAISAWRNKLIDSKEIFRPLRTMRIRSRMDFPEFLARLVDWPTEALNDHFLPQSRLLELPKRKCELHIFHTEDQLTGWRQVCQEIEARGGMALEPIPVVNRSSGAGKSAYLERDDVRAMLNRLYGSDYDEYGYQRP